MSESTYRTVVLVGHCGPDMFMLRSAIGRIVPGAAIETVNDQGTLDSFLTDDAVLLVNRQLDGAFETGSGIDLIRTVSAGASPPRAILISNFEEAQSEAEAAGAQPGFGKNALYDESTSDRLRAAAARS